MNKILILGLIGTEEGQTSAQMVNDELDAFGDVDHIVVDINSTGGSISEGNAIYLALREHPAKITTRVITQAMSMGSVIFLAGDERLISEGGFVMIHEPAADVFGTAKELGKASKVVGHMLETMAKLYANRTSLDETNAAEMMAEETWLYAEEAIQLGFATGLFEPELAMVAKFDPTKYKNAPQRLVAKLKPKTQKEETMALTAKDIRALCKNASSDFILEQLEGGASEVGVLRAFGLLIRAEADEEKEEAKDADAKATAKAESDDKEIEDLKAKLKALEDAKALEDEDEDEDEDREEDEEDEMVNAKGRARRGVRSKVRLAVKANTARDEWREKLAVLAEKGIKSHAAVKMVNKQNPGLRVQMLNESRLNQKRRVKVEMR